MRIFTILFVLLFSATIYASDLNFTGDVRLRHEVIDDSTNTNQSTRQRVRARLNAEATVSDTTTVGLGLATGSADRRSTNQTLSGNFSSKSINLDTAYIKTELLGGDLTLGKFKNPLTNVSELFWDNDVRPEGVTFATNYKNFVIKTGYLVLEDTAVDDPALIVGQLGYSGNHFILTGSYTTTKNATRNSYVNVNGALKSGSLFGLELNLIGDYVVNTEASTDDTAWLVGVGTTFKGLGIQYAYREVEANSVNALLTDSDFGNGVDVKGSEFNLCYAYNDVKVGATYFLLDNGLTNGTDYDRLQLDLTVKF
jgi:hypothetical protein